MALIQLRLSGLVVESVPKGQIEAGLEIGFKPLSVFRYIILLPALSNIYPALIGQVVLALLFTSVVSQIATEDLTKRMSEKLETTLVA